MYKLKFTRLQNEIFRLLCIKVGSKLNQREIATLLKVSPTAVGKALSLLEKECLVKVERSKTMNLSYILLNRDNPFAVSLKRVENLKMLYESGIVEYFGDTFPGCVIIMFGSYSRGEDTVKSDIDIAVLGSKRKDTELAKFGKMLERPVVLNFYDDIKGLDKNLRSNIMNGITLVGVVEI
jgi:predicted nucleotidyltransferase